MSGLPPRDRSGDDRLTDLLIDEATVGLDAAEAAELRSLMDAASAHDQQDEREAWSLLAAEIAVADDEADLAADPKAIPPMPGDLAARLMEDGRRHLAGGGVESDAAPTPSLRIAGTPKAASPDAELAWWRTPWIAWTVAAACLALAVLLALDPARQATPDADPADPRVRLARFLETAPDARVIPWGDNPDGIAGDVVWSDRLQAGYLRMRGIDANDPTEIQYQLWIFDAERTEPFHAVDGGVFDVNAAQAAGDGEVIVPIDPKLRVFEPSLFAITTEPPGGVVKHVTDEERGFRILVAADAAGS